MYLHIGGESVMDDKDIIALIPRKNVLISRDTRSCIADAIGSGKIQSVSGESQKTYIICQKGKLTVYASPISSITLMRRGNQGKEIE